MDAPQMVAKITAILFVSEFFIMPIIFYFIIKYTARKTRKENMSKIDFKKNKDYYREILKEFSPSELSFIDDFEIKGKREIVATILNLKLKGKVEITNNEIIVLNTNIDDLRKTEKFILENIKDGKVVIEDSIYISVYARDEAQEDNLISEITDANEKVRDEETKIFILVSIIVVLIMMLFKLELVNSTAVMVIFMISILMIPICVVILPGYIASYRAMQNSACSRTEKGEEINIKIEGLKQYLKDYSLLHEKDQHDLSVWEEYLIYSVIFDLNQTNIVQDISKLIEIKYEYKTEEYKAKEE